METVLGLSMTSTGIGWVLRDEADGVAATTLEHDTSDLASDFVPEVAADEDVSRHTAAVRGAQAIAASNGRMVNSIHVTWSDDAADKAPLLLKSLPDLGFEHVVPVKLKEAARTWALALGNALGFETCAVCLVEATSVTILTVGYGTVRTAAATHTSDRGDSLSSWVAEVFEKNRLHPDGLLLVGARDDLEPITTCLQASLSIPIIASDDSQLALARGAASASPPEPQLTASTASQQMGWPPGDRHQQPRMWSPTTLVHELSDRPSTWAVGALAACAVAGLIASFAFSPEFTGQSDSPPTVNRPASNSASSSDPSAVSSPTQTPTAARAMPSSAVPLPAPTVRRQAVRPAVVGPQHPATVPASDNSTLPRFDIGSGITASTTEQPILRQTPTPVVTGGASAHSGGVTPDTPFPFPDFFPKDDEPTDDPIGGDPDVGSGDGQDTGDGGQDTGGGGQDTGGGGQDTGGGPDTGGGGQDGPGGGGQDNGGGGQNGPGGGQDNGGGQDGGGD